MAVFQRVAPTPFHPVARPFTRPFAPAPVRTVYQPPRVIERDIVRNVYQPPRVIEKDIYHTNTVYMNRGWSPERSRAFEEGVRRREYERLMREQGLTAQVAAAQAQAYAAQQALQQQQLQAQQAILNPPPQPSVSPGSAAADLSPQQDAAAASADAGDGGEPAHKPKHLLLYVAIAGGAAVFGYMALKKKKKKGSSHSSSAE